MMLETLFVVSSLGAATAHWQAPRTYIEGAPYLVVVEITAGDTESVLDAWALSPGAFVLNGKPIQDRGEGTIVVAPGSVTRISFDLAPYIARAPGFQNGEFNLGYAEKYTRGESIDVKCWQAAPEGLDFMTMPEADLTKYQVVLTTNQGEMVAEFWPDDAPNHVRNFLDLSYTGFYDGTTFHRVIPGFMIQGGDPTGTGTGSGPRPLKAEFNDRKHTRGVLSMARSNSPDSASCQFFVMHADASHLDGDYSVFGQLSEGLDVLEKIVNTPRGQNDRPKDPQTIEKATVIIRPQGGPE